MQLPFARSRSRRQGQALILAVLVMLFAVLLSSAFLVVIGNSGRQVGRETERSDASRNADKGVALVTARLQRAVNPDNWNPQADASLVAQAYPTVPQKNVPSSVDADYNLYYSPLDIAMGWADKKYVKYPDPRTSRQAPQFLVSSHLLGTSFGDDKDGGDKRFMLRIEVIGLSSKNPDLWSRRILYKTTNWNGGTFSYSNFVTSFDPDTQKPIVSALSATFSVAATDVGNNIPFSVYQSKGVGNERVAYSPRITDVGNTLMISDGVNTPVVGIVAPPTGGTPNLHILKTGANPATFGVNSKVALVGSLFELPQQVAADGTTATLQDTQKQDVIGVQGDTLNTDVRPYGNGAQYNEGLNVPITTSFAERRPDMRTYLDGATTKTTLSGQNALTSSGPVSIGDRNASVLTPPSIHLVGAPVQKTPSPLPTATFIPDATPSGNQFLRISYTQLGASQVDTSSSLVAPVVVPRSVKPAQLNFASYRTKSLQGLTDQTGYYISNFDDVEKFDGQPLTISQLHRLWQRKSFPVNSVGNIAYTGNAGAITTGTDKYVRLCYGRPGTDTYTYPMDRGGLEAKGIRGWISPWEFLPRGAQVILRPADPSRGHLNPYITIIRDPLSDISTNAPDLNKAINRTTRSFSEDIDPSTTGPLYLSAEGNLRVSGEWSGAPISIVSANNIYIEGQLKTTINSTTGLRGQIALLAKKNVVLNPTQFVSRPVGTVDTSVGQTAFLGSVSSNVVTLKSGKESFKVGDKVAVFANPGRKSDGWHTVQSINGNQLTFPNPSLPGAEPAIVDAAEVKIKLACDPPIVLAQRQPGDDVPSNEHYEPVVGDPPAKDETINEVPINATNLAAADTFWAYAFKTGGDTLTRYVPFTDINGTQYTIGVAARQATSRKNILFTVQGGTDPDPNQPQDDGVRKFNIRQNTDPTKPYELLVAPKPGDINQQDTFDLRDLGNTGSAQADGATQNLQALNALFTSRAADGATEKTRWRIPDVTNTKIANLQGRRFARVKIPDFTLGLPVDDENPPLTTIRAPLTSSVLLFGGGLPSTTITSTNILLRIGSLFDYQDAAGDPTLETNFIDASTYGRNPVWDHPAGSGTTDVVTYSQSQQTDTLSWTRDGAGDYDDQLPTYFLYGWRFQRVNGNQSVAATSTDPKVNKTVEVDATIYAEGGSWFVIPVPTPDSNVASPPDAQQKVEWRRPAYAVTINGNITQMMTPSATYDYDNEPDPDGIAIGAMQRWTDSLSYQVTDGTTTRWQTINYRSASLPAIATNVMGVPQTDPFTGQYQIVPLPNLPSSDDILYTYSN